MLTADIVKHVSRKKQTNVLLEYVIMNRQLDAFRCLLRSRMIISSSLIYVPLNLMLVVLLLFIVMWIFDMSALVNHIIHCQLLTMVCPFLLILSLILLQNGLLPNLTSVTIEILFSLYYVNMITKLKNTLLWTISVVLSYIKIFKIFINALKSTSSVIMGTVQHGLTLSHPSMVKPTEDLTFTFFFSAFPRNGSESKNTFAKLGRITVIAENSSTFKSRRMLRRMLVNMLIAVLTFPKFYAYSFGQKRHLHTFLDMITYTIIWTVLFPCSNETIGRILVRVCSMDRHLSNVFRFPDTYLVDGFRKLSDTLDYLLIRYLTARYVLMRYSASDLSRINVMMCKESAQLDCLMPSSDTSESAKDWDDFQVMARTITAQNQNMPTYIPEFGGHI